MGNPFTNKQANTSDLPNPSAESTPLHARVAKGGVWIILLRIIQQLMAVARLIILARLLAPSDFGIFGIAMLTMATLDMFTQTGFRVALVQKKHNTESYLNTAWTLGIIRSSILFVVIFTFAPFVILFFDGSAKLQPNDFSEPDKLVYKLLLDQSPPSKFINENLSDETRQKLLEYSGEIPVPDHLLTSLTTDMNLIIELKQLDNEPSFSSILTKERPQKLIGNYRPTSDQARINRLLLEETFADEIQKKIIDLKNAILILQVIGASLFLGAFSNIGTIYFTKDLNFYKQFLQEIGGTTVNVAVAITIALLYKSVWALVLGRLAGQFFQFVLSYILHPYRPHLHLEWAKAKELWNFGKWILGSSIIGFLFTQGDDIFVGKVVGITALGLYQFAYHLASLPATEITHIISRVTFPAYSKLQDNLPKLKDAYLKVLTLTAFISLPLAGIIFILTPEFVILFLKEKWLEMIPAMQILAIFGCSRSLGATRGPLLQAVKKVHLSTKLQFARLVLLAIVIYPLTKQFGITGTALAILITDFCAKPFGIYIGIKITHSGLWEILRPTFYPLISTIMMTVTVAGCKYLFIETATYASFFTLAATGILTYIGTTLALIRLYNYQIINIIQDQFKSLRT